MIEASVLSKSYDGRDFALSNLTLVVRPGEIYCLLGANGAGKSTTINLFLDFIRPTSGRALVNGVEVAANPLEAKRHLAFLSERVSLYGSLTALQNLDYFVRLAGAGPLPRRRLEEAMERVGLPGSTFHQKVREFSKGMRQKLGIAICVAKDAPALFLDEPMGGLDPKAAKDLTLILEELRLQGKALLVSTHDIFRAKRLADKVGILRRGVQVVERTRQELENEQLEELYFRQVESDAPSMTAPS